MSPAATATATKTGPGVGVSSGWVAVVARCQGCGACLLTCPQRAIRPHGGRLEVLPSCDGCAECIEVCPVDAIDLVPGGCP